MEICSAYMFIFMQIKLIFYMKGSERRLVLKQRHKVTGKWPVGVKLTTRTKHPWGTLYSNSVDICVKSFSSICVSGRRILEEVCQAGNGTFYHIKNRKESVNTTPCVHCPEYTNTELHFLELNREKFGKGFPNISITEFKLHSIFRVPLPSTCNYGIWEVIVLNCACAVRLTAVYIWIGVTSCPESSFPLTSGRGTRFWVEVLLLSVEVRKNIRLPVELPLQLTLRQMLMVTRVLLMNGILELEMLSIFILESYKTR